MIWYGMWKREAEVIGEEVPKYLLRRGNITIYEHDVRFQRPERKREAMDPEIDDILSMVGIVNNSWFNFFTFFLIAMIPVIPLALTRFGQLFAATYAGIIEGLLGLFFTLSGNAFFVAMLQGIAEECAQHVFFNRPLFTLLWVGIEWAQLVDGMNTLLLNKVWPPEHLERMWIERGQKVGAAGYAPPIDCSEYLYTINEFRSNDSTFVKPSDFLKYLDSTIADIFRKPDEMLMDIFRAADPAGVQWLGYFQVSSPLEQRNPWGIMPISFFYEKDLPFLEKLRWSVRNYLMRVDPPKYIGAFDIVWRYLKTPVHGAIPIEPAASAIFLELGSWPFRAPYTKLNLWHIKGYEVHDEGYDISINRGWWAKNCDYLASAGKVKLKIIIKHGNKTFERTFILPISAVVDIDFDNFNVDDFEVSRSASSAKRIVPIRPGIFAIEKKVTESVSVQLKLKNDENANDCTFHLAENDGVDLDAIEAYVRYIPEDIESKDSSGNNCEIKLTVASTGNNNAFTFSYGFLSNYGCNPPSSIVPKSLPEFVMNKVNTLASSIKEELGDFFVKLAGLIMLTLLAPVVAITGARIFYEQPFWARWVIGEERLEKTGLAIKVFAPTLSDFLNWTTVYYPGILKYLIIEKAAPVIPGPTAPFCLAAGAPVEHYIVRDPFRGIRGLTLADIITYWMMDIADIAKMFGLPRGYGIAAPSWAENFVGKFMDDYIPPALPGVAGGGMIYFSNLRKIINAIEKAWRALYYELTERIPKELYQKHVGAPYIPSAVSEVIVDFEECVFKIQHKTEIRKKPRYITYNSLLRANLASFIGYVCDLALTIYKLAWNDVSRLIARLHKFIYRSPFWLRPRTLYSVIAACSDQPIEAFWHMRAQAFARTLALETDYLRAWSRGETLD